MSTAERRAAANAAVNSNGKAEEFPQGEFISPEDVKSNRGPRVVRSTVWGMRHHL